MTIYLRNIPQEIRTTLISIFAILEPWYDSKNKRLFFTQADNIRKH